MKNNFKKLAAVVLALVMCVSTLVPVFAAEDVCPGEGAVHTATNCTYTVVGTTEADCDTNGAVTGRCNTCLVTFAVSTTPALGHKYETIEGDCTTGARQVCATCGDTKNVAAAADHQWATYVVDGGECKIGATVTKTCSVCGATEQETMEYEHNWVLVSLTEPESCLTKGTASYKCGACDATQTREVWADDAQYHDWKVIPTFATETALKAAWESTYKDLLTLEELRLGAKAKAATCIATGVNPLYCANCGETDVRTVAKTTHYFAVPSNSEGITNVNKTADWAKWLDKVATATAPTCKETGFKPYVECNVPGCKAVKTLDVDYIYVVNSSNKYDGTMDWAIDLPLADDEKADLEAITIITTKLSDYELAPSHVWVSEAGTAPTCEDEGYYLVTCDEGCDWEKEIEPEALGHKFWYDLTKKEQDKLDKDDYVEILEYQSCQAPETTEYTCINCGVETEEVETAEQLECVASSIYGADSVLPAKCGKAGKKIIVCKMCGDKMGTEEIPALEHDLTKVVVTKYPTHTEKGTYYYDCANEDYVEILGRKYTTDPALGTKGKVVDAGKGTPWIFYGSDMACTEVDTADGLYYEMKELAETAHEYVIDCAYCDAGCKVCAGRGVLGIDDPNAIIECQQVETTKTYEFKCSDPDCDAKRNVKATKTAHSFYDIKGEDHQFNEFVLGAIRSEGDNVGSCTVARQWEVACKNCFVTYADLDAAITAKAYDLVEDTATGKGHNKVVVSAKVEPTCTTFGAEEVYYCSNCTDFGTATAPTGGIDTVTGEAEVIEMTHTYTATELKNLIKRAVVNLKYEILDLDLDTFVDVDDADPLNKYDEREDYQAWVAFLKADKEKDVEDRTYLKEVAIDDTLTFVFAVPGTCTTAPVLGGFKCSKCNVASLNADNDNWLPATETLVNGMDEPVGNKHEIDFTAPALEVVNNGCGTESYEVRACDVCEAFFLTNYTKLEHEFLNTPDEGTLVVPTCVLDGSASYTCQVAGCNFVKVVTEPAHGHKTDVSGVTGGVSQPIKDTCLDRTVDRFCGVCKQTIPMSHRFGEWTVNGEVETRTCVDCGTVEEKAVQAPETEAPVTDAPVTEAPVTDAPETDAPTTDAPETEAPADEKGCGSSIAAIGVALVATLGTCAVFCGKKKED